MLLLLGLILGLKTPFDFLLAILISM